MQNRPGKPGRKQVRGITLDATEGIPDPPDYLSAEACAEWNRRAAQLQELGIVDADHSLLAAFCMAHAIVCDCETEIKQKGRFYVTDKGKSYLHPWVDLQMRAITEMRQLSEKLGFNPASRAKLPPAKVTTTNPAEKYAGLIGGPRNAPR